MALVDLHLLIQCILYFCIFICGFVISIPIGVNSINFDGMCILFSDFAKNDKGGFQMTPSSKGNCNFPIYLGVFGCIFYGLILCCFYAFATRRSRKSTSVGSQMWVMPYMLMNSALALTLLVASSMVSVGFKSFCDHVKEYGKVENCKDEEHRDWTNIETGETFNTKNFYSLLTVTQVASWIAVLLFSLQIALGILRFRRNRRLRFTESDKERIAGIEPSA